MGLSITSSAPKVSGNNAGGLAGTTQTDAVPGDFLALLTNELGNFFLAPVASTTQALDSTTPATEEKPLSVEATEAQLPQVDPALIATLNAAAAAIQNTTSIPTQNQSLPLNLTPNPTIGEGISIAPNTQASSQDTAQLKGETSILSFSNSNPQIQDNKPSLTSLVTNKAETAIQTQYVAPEQSGRKPFSLDIGKSQTAPQQFSSEILKTAADISPTQTLSAEINILSNNATNATSSSPQQKPVNHFETDVGAHIQEKIWPQQFGEKMVWMAKADVQSAQINLNPPELGPIQITLNLSGDQAKLTFASPHLEVRQSIENALPQLKEMLSSSGISLGQANVGANLQQQPREAQFQSTNGRHSADENAILSGSEATIATGMNTSIQRGRGLVDLFA